MKKGTSSMRLHFSLLALAIALTGCPNPGPNTNANPDPSPSASSSPEQPTAEIKTLGLVKAEIKASAFTLGLPSYAVYLGNLGTLAAKGAGEPPQFSQLFKFPHSVEFPDSYAWVDGMEEPDYTHTFLQAFPEDVYQDMAFTLGGQAATQRVLAGSYVRVTFPADAAGALTVTPPEQGGLRFKTQHTVATDPQNIFAHFTFDASLSIPVEQQEQMAVHGATASVTVAVSELNGEPSTGLTVANFALSAANTTPFPHSIKGKVVTVNETEPGLYAVTATFDGLSGSKASARKLTVQVGNPTLHSEVTP